MRSRGFGHGGVVSKICYNAVIVLAAAMWLLQTNEQLSRLSFSPQWVGSGTTCLSAADVRKMWGTAEKRFVRHVCLRNPFPPFYFGIPSSHSLPEADSWEWQYVPPALHFGCIMPIPSLQLQKKSCLMMRSRGFGLGVVFSKICYNAVIVLSAVLCDCCKPMNNCRDWAFSHSGLEAGLPAFQLPMFAKCEALPKRDLFLF